MFFFLWLFLTQNLLAEPIPKNIVCPSPRKSIENFLNNLQHNQWYPEQAVACFEGHREESLPAAIQLKQVLDAKGWLLYLDDYSYSSDFVDEETKKSIVVLHPQLPQVTLFKDGNRWLFSQSSYPIISQAYQETFSSFFSQFLNTLPAWTKTRIIFNIQIWQFLYFTLLLLFSWMIGRVLDKIVIHRLLNLAHKYKLEVTKQKLALMRKPIFWMCFGLILMYGTPDLKLSVQFSLAIMWVCKFIVTLSVLLLLSRLLNSLAEIMINKASKTDSKLDDQLVPLLRRTFQVVLWSLGGIFLLQNYGVDVTSLITVGSLATVGIALASKDALENLFGSIVAFIDQPFQIGDWVIIDNSIEGVVEEVGFRSTRIRAFTNSLITVPNAKITKCTVNNFGKREMRRFKCTLSLRYDTPVEKIEEYLKAVRDILQHHPSVVKEAIFVYLNQMSASSLDIMVYTFFTVPDWRDELVAKEQLFLSFMHSAQKIGVGFAFPTQTVEVEYPQGESQPYNPPSVSP